MKTNLLKELILPSFWLFFFIVSKNDNKINTLKKEDKKELYKQNAIPASETANSIKKGKEAIFVKAVYLSGY